PAPPHSRALALSWAGWEPCLWGCRMEHPILPCARPAPCARCCHLAKDLLLRAERSPLGPAKGKKPGRRRDGPNCTVRRLMVKVRDLGLGFDSDEIVPFKYCSGSCHRSRSNYDLTLATLLQEKAIKPGPPGHVASHPCCRPTRYEAVSFMNVQNTWQTVEKLSAAECKCIG
uniref:Artemin n=1 Tax=Terrapene triunguis TaxID=2587831 RepID=A0A674IR37_9SAUR